MLCNVFPWERSRLLVLIVRHSFSKRRVGRGRGTSYSYVIIAAAGMCRGDMDLYPDLLRYCPGTTALVLSVLGRPYYSGVFPATNAWHDYSSNMSSFSSSSVEASLASPSRSLILSVLLLPTSLSSGFDAQRAQTIICVELAEMNRLNSTHLLISTPLFTL